MFDPVSLAIVVTAALGSAGVKGLVDRFTKHSGESMIVLKSRAGVIVTLDPKEKLTEEQVQAITAALSPTPGAAKGEATR